MFYRTKRRMLCVYTFLRHTLILSDRDWNSFDRKDKIFKVKQQSWSGWMHFPQRPVNNQQNSPNSTIYHVQMQIRGAGAGSLTVWLVDIGCGVWGQIAALQLQHEQIRNVTLTMTNKTHLTKYRCSTECHYYFTCQRPAWSTELFIVFIIFIFTTFLNITNRIWPLFMQAGRVPTQL